MVYTKLEEWDLGRAEIPHLKILSLNSCHLRKVILPRKTNELETITLSKQFSNADNNFISDFKIGVAGED